MSFTPTTRLNVAFRFDGSLRPVGQLALAQRRLLFEFAPSFLKDGLPLSPFTLPVKTGVHEEKKYTFEGLHGVFNDSLPDGWGRLLLDRAMEGVGVRRDQLTPLDRLAFVGSAAMGALTYEPAAASGEPVASTVDLLRLAEASRQVLAGDSAAVVAELLELGGSSGGARPKVFVDYHPERDALAVGSSVPQPGYLPLLVKFAARSDPEDVGAVEYAYAAMARAAGIRVSPTWLLRPSPSHPGFFGTRRFDRDDEHRVHVHSLSGLLHASHRFPSTNYETLLNVTRRLTRDQRSVESVFRRMVFNVAAHNRDDHSKNFAFQMSAAGEWSPTPAYDLTFSEGPGGTHWMALGGECKAPGRGHLLATARGAGVPEKAALAALDEVRAAVARWEAFASAAGVSRGSAERIGARLGSVDRDLRG